LNRLSNDLTVVDGVTDRVIRTVPGVGDRPDIGDFAPDGRRLFVSLRGQAVTGDPALLSGKEPGLAVIDATTGERVGYVPLGGDPHGVTVRP
jgi:YVTN family beta-propeller protein